MTTFGSGTFCCVLLLVTLTGNIHCAENDTTQPTDYDELEELEVDRNITNNRLGRQEEKSVNMTLGSTVLCYIGSWANFRPETKDFRPLKHINGSLCTHAIYAFARLCDNGTLCPSEAGNSQLDEDNLSYRGIGALKRKWNNLRVGVSIGGWAEGSERFSLLAASPWSRSQFINALIETLRTYNMTAVELAWISPTIRSGGKPYDRQNYVDLIRDVSRAIRPRGWHLGVAVKVDDGKVDAYYDLAGIARYADWLHVQAFDFHGHWEEFAGINAPLRSYEDDKSTVENWMRHVAARAGGEKLLLGMPLFGRSWRLVPSPVPEAPGAAALGPATYDGLMSFKELCVKLKSNVTPIWNQRWDNVSKTPWAIQGATNFVSFDDQRSLTEKVDFARKMNVAGVAVFTIDQDDYTGECGMGKFPLMTAVKKAIDERVGD